jgi:ferredoxin
MTARDILGFAGRPPDRHLEACLNHRHAGARCRACETSCPTAAITIPDGISPILDPDSCVGCGSCVAACPTEAFSAGWTSVGSLERTAAAVTGGVHLTCSFNRGAGVPEGSTPVEIDRCLAAVDTSTLVILSVGGSRRVTLDISACAECPIGGLVASVAQASNAANLILSAADLEATVALVEDPGGRLVRSRRLSESDLSRRDLFGLLGTARHPDDSAHRPDGLPTLPRSVPSRRRRLIRRLSTWELPTDADLATTITGFGRVDVDDQRCSLCGLCAGFCPTNALIQIERHPGQVALGFTPAQCLDCRICLVACPDDAIRLGPTVSLVQVAEATTHVLIEDVSGPCIDCGLPTRLRPSDREHRCHSCRHGSGPVDALRDRAGLMADLLSRLPDAAGTSPPEEAGDG